MELLDEAKQRCVESMRERRGEDISAADLDEAASVMGYGAVKYADLKNNRNTNYKCVATPSPRRLHAAACLVCGSSAAAHALDSRLQCPLSACQLMSVAATLPPAPEQA